MFIPTDDYSQVLEKLQPNEFDHLALNLFLYQSHHNALYNQYLQYLGIHPRSIRRVEDIPFLPISFFKTHKVLTKDPLIEKVFESSGTTATVNSKHYVASLKVYETVHRQGFEKQYGPLQAYTILALLPSYLERSNSSLVYMVEQWMALSKKANNGFFLHDSERLHQILQQVEAQKIKTLLLGVTFALLDFAEKYAMPLQYTTLMETGGMKGRREEQTREQVHLVLQEKFAVNHIHSEYGMTELLSQAYSPAQGIFIPSPTMKVLVRDPDDPLTTHTQGSGALNIIDLANVHSCSFIATEDVGSVYQNGSFQVQGRLDHSALRGCSLMGI